MNGRIILVGRGPRRTGQWRALCWLLVSCICLGLGCRDREGLERLTEPMALPDLALERLGGGSFALSEARGRTLIIDFWATWCAPCQFQVPVLNRFYDAHRSDSDVAIFGVSVDATGDEELVERWVAEHEVRYPILLGGEALLRAVRAEGIPLLIVVGPDGLVHSEHMGVVELEALEAVLTEQRTAPAG